MVATTTAPVTERELAVLRLIALGECQKTAGQKLGISENTVRNHLANCRERLEVYTTIQAIAIVWDWLWMQSTG